MHAYYRSGRALWSLWSLLTLAGIGFGVLSAGIYLESYQFVGLGTGVFTLAGMAFLLVQFWKVSTLPARPVLRQVPEATQVAVTSSPAVPAAASDAAEDLVEFQLVGEKEVPTSLEVPAAFHMEARADAAPPEPAPALPWLVKDATGAANFVPATERRKEIVEGLPLLSAIFSGDHGAATASTADRPGRTRGQCGGCGTMLWAPMQRPLRLRCPKCGHVRTLTE